MKLLKLSFIIVGIFYLTHRSKAQDQNDETKIKTMVQKYFTAARNDNPDLMKEVFHSTASYRYIIDKYTIVSMPEFFSIFTNTNKRVFESKIHHIDVTGNAASAKLSLKYADHQYTDYMILMKMEEGWRVVNKISYKEIF